MDVILKLERENGTLLAQADDSPGSADPVLEFTVPADVKALVAVIEDVHGRGKPNFVYRVVVRPVGASPDPDFRVFLTDAEMNVPSGGSRLVEVAIDRRGYNGPVKLAFDKLPPGIQVQGTEVPAGANGCSAGSGRSGEPSRTRGCRSARGTYSGGDRVTRQQHRSESAADTAGRGANASAAQPAALAGERTGPVPDAEGDSTLRREVGQPAR